MEKRRLKIGVSACLLGERVRYDGGEKESPALRLYLVGRYELVPICPEVAAGLGVPRPAVQLVVSGTGIRALGVMDSQMDVTEPLVNYGREVAGGQFGFAGFVFKSRSPSCGLGSAPIYGEEPLRYGDGLFTRQITQVWPDLPVIDEESLEQEPLRNLFLQQVEEYGERLKLGN